MTQLFSRYVQTPPANLNEEGSRKWLREKSMEVEGLYSANVLKRKEAVNTSRMIPGRCYFFRYEAKHRETLPYYDMYPVIFPISTTRTHFIGLNLHYLPVQFRAVLMDNLYPYVVGEDNMTRIKITYSILQNASKLRYYKPCLKQYLNTHIRSKLVEVSAEEWEMALFLPLQRYIGTTVGNVYKDSVRMIRSTR